MVEGGEECFYGRKIKYCCEVSYLSIFQEDRSGCRCFLFGPDEAVTRSTADLICAGHSGSWVAELDHPGTPSFFFRIAQLRFSSYILLIRSLLLFVAFWIDVFTPGINYWLKSQVLAQIPVGERASFWMGGRTEGYHSDHQPGTWTWDHMNETIEW